MHHLINYQVNWNYILNWPLDKKTHTHTNCTGSPQDAHTHTHTHRHTHTHTSIYGHNIYGHNWSNTCTQVRGLLHTLVFNCTNRHNNRHTSIRKAPPKNKQQQKTNNYKKHTPPPPSKHPKGLCADQSEELVLQVVVQPLHLLVAVHQAVVALTQPHQLLPRLGQLHVHQQPPFHLLLLHLAEGGLTAL